MRALCLVKQLLLPCTSGSRSAGADAAARSCKPDPAGFNQDTPLVHHKPTCGGVPGILISPFLLCSSLVCDICLSIILQHGCWGKATGFLEHKILPNADSLVYFICVLLDSMFKQQQPCIVRLDNQSAGSCTQTSLDRFSLLAKLFHASSSSS